MKSVIILGLCDKHRPKMISNTLSRTGVFFCFGLSCQSFFCLFGFGVLFFLKETILNNLQLQDNWKSKCKLIKMVVAVVSK